jgi:hypothetical protein
MFSLHLGMRALRYIWIFLAFGVTVAHSVSVHHHHVAANAPEVESVDHHHDHDRHNNRSQEHQHSPFSFTQIDDTFINGKVQAAHVAVLPVLICFAWVDASRIEKEPTQYFFEDIELPPPISRSNVSFRGPPFIS